MARPRRLSAEEIDTQYRKRRENIRRAQATFRQRNAERLAMARRVAHILQRKTSHPGDARELAAAIRTLLGENDTRELTEELERPDPTRHHEIVCKFSIWGRDAFELLQRHFRGDGHADRTV
jgi:hypothetical protein